LIQPYSIQIQNRMLQKTRGIVLHHIKYGDSSIILKAYTRDKGRQSLMVKGVRRKKSKNKINLFSILNILNIEYYAHEARELSLIREASRVRTYQSIPFDLKKSSMAMFIAEVLLHCLKEESPDEDLYDFIENSLEYFDNMEEGFENFHIAFLIKLTRYLGILPSMEEKILKGNQTWRVINELLVNNYNNPTSFSMNQKNRNILLEEIIKYYTKNGYKIDKTNSLDILKQLFS